MAKIGAATICACLFILVVLFSATQVAEAAAPVVEQKRTCESQSHRFKGKCLSNHNCGSVCNTEGFPAAGAAASGSGVSV